MTSPPSTFQNHVEGLFEKHARAIRMASAIAASFVTGDSPWTPPRSHYWRSIETPLPFVPSSQRDRDSLLTSFRSPSPSSDRLAPVPVPQALLVIELEEPVVSSFLPRSRALIPFEEI